MAETFSYPWKLGVISDQVGLELSSVLGFCRKYELQWIEIRYLKLGGKKSYVYADANPSELRELRRTVAGAGLKVSVLDTAIYKIALPGTNPVGEAPAYVDADKTDFGRQLEHLKRAADAAHALGTQRLRIFTFRRVSDPSAVFDRVVDEMQKALRVAAEQDITLLVENEYDCNVGTANEVVSLFKGIPDKRLMHNWDPCNSYEIGEEPFPKVWNEIDHSRISHIHLKDAAGQVWKPIGAGEVNLAGQFRALKALGYSGTMSLETRYKDELKDQYSSTVESMNGLIHILRGT